MTCYGTEDKFVPDRLFRRTAWLPERPSIPTSYGDSVPLHGLATCYRANHGMTHWKLILAYDGTPFHGWQIQPGLPSIQGTLSDAICRVVGERVLPQGSGRTDTGVHALAQVASFAVHAPIPPDNFHRALNRCLPNSIRISSVEIVPPDFHARHSALRKSYEYRIFPLRPPDFKRLAGLDATRDRICLPMLAPYVWPCRWPLDLAALSRAAQHVLGMHDFTSFAASDPDLTSRTASPAHEDLAAADRQIRLPIRTISHSLWKAEGELLIYRVTANGFLHHMVRNLVGTLVQAGAHRIKSDEIPVILAARDRSAAGPTAPASGLFLLNVEYPELLPQAVDNETQP